MTEKSESHKPIKTRASVPLVHHLFRSAVVMVFALGLVFIGAEELRRKTKRVQVNDAAGHRMVQQLHPGMAYNKDKGELAPPTPASGDSNARASLQDSQRSESEKEKLDPTGLRALLNRLLK